MTVTYKEYEEEKMEFIKKHNAKSDCKVETSPMVNNRYHKEYMWEDGACWCELSELVSEIAEVVVHGITVKTSVDLWRTEFWSTESGSKYFYEKA